MASAFGVFQLVANDGRQDHMLMATELLNQRIAQIKSTRQAAGFSEQDTYPSILDIERTHIIFTTAHFKPFAAIAFEYHREDPEGQIRLNSNIRYSIAQYGDFFADMVHYMKFVPLTYTSGNADPDKDVFRYADFVGERLHREVRFTVNGNKLDSYEYEAHIMHRQFRVAPNKIDGWKRLVGQELPHEAFLAQEAGTQPLTRVALDVYDGYQTPRKSHPALEVTVPLLFWFCKDFRLSIPSVAIPYGQRWITITTPESSDLVELVAPSGSANTDDTPLGPLEFDDAALYVNNLFVNSEIHDIFIRRIGFTLIRVHLWHEAQLTASSGRVKLDSLQWPIEALFFGFRPIVNYDYSQAVITNADHAMYSRVGGFGTLQNWHRFCHVDWTSEGVAGVQSCKKDVESEDEIQLMCDATLTAASDPPTIRTELLAGLPGPADTPPVSKWGNYLLATVEAAMGYSKGIAASDADAADAGIAARDRVCNEYAENAVWVGVADVNGTAAAQVAAYQAAEAAFTGTSTQLSTDLLAYIEAAAAEYGATSNSVWCAVQLSGFLNHNIRLGNCAKVEVRRNSPVVSTIGLSAHNVKLYDQQYAQFFHSYLPYAYGGPNINTPTDECLHFISFALYPGTYQPSGHINVSRAREFFMSYQTARPVDSSNPVQLLVYASAINFLLIADGSASLRYTT